MGASLLTELASLPEVRVGHFGSLLVFVWRGMVSVGSLDRTNAIEAEIIAKHGKISVIGVITDLSAGVPDAAMRTKARDAMKQFQPNVRGTALVVIADGTKAVLVRTFLAGLSLVIDFFTPMKSFRNVADAVAWVWRLEGQDAALMVAELPQAVAEFVAESRPADKPRATNAP